ncbi:MAG: bifunctional phosphoglucose/phosphomannose isomerase [Patescibacteria group bacterium]|nr:bifunctional phosphoglucose/phosphomannose isomerase [Patescibacteria group bacterium]
MTDNNFPKNFMHYDSQKLLEEYNELTANIKSAYKLGDTVGLPSLKEDIDHVFVIGMGGSAISGDLLKLFLESEGYSKPVSVIRDYKVPLYMTKNSLVFVISYSGNTEETLNAYRRTLRKTDNVIAIGTGGKLEETANLNRRSFLPVPKGHQPRTAALSFLFFPLIKILERLDEIEKQEHKIAKFVNDIVKPDFKRLAISISAKLFEKTPIIYASSKYYPLAYRLKTQINENAKTHAFANQYSEINHNEILALERSQEEYHVITFQFDDDHRRIIKRMGFIKEMNQKAEGSTTEIKLSGPNILTKMFSGLIIGDLSSYYLALRYGRDPSPVPTITKLKEKMGSYISN